MSNLPEGSRVRSRSVLNSEWNCSCVPWSAYSAMMSWAPKPGVDYHAGTAALVRELGFEAAVTTAWGAAAAGSDRYQLPRFSPWDRRALRYGWRLLGNMGRPAAIAVAPATTSV